MSGVDYQIPLGTLLSSLECDHPYYLLECQYQIQLPSHRWWGSLAEGLYNIDVDAYSWHCILKRCGVHTLYIKILI